MTNQKTNLAALLMLTALVTSAANAAATATTTPAANETTATIADVKPVSPMDNMVLQQATTFYMGSLEEPFAKNVINNDTGVPGTTAMFQENATILGYKLGAGGILSAGIYYNTVLSDNPRVTVLDPALRYQTTLIDSGKLNMVGSFRYYLPVTDKSRNANSYGKVQARLFPSYSPNGSWTIKFQNRLALTANEAFTEKSEIELISIPALTYNFNDMWSTSLAYEAWGYRHVNGLDKTGNAEGTFRQADSGTDIVLSAWYQPSATVGLGAGLTFVPTSDIGLKSSNTTLSFDVVLNII